MQYFAFGVIAEVTLDEPKMHAIRATMTRMAVSHNVFLIFP